MTSPDPDEPLILVDERNRMTGTAGKMLVHERGLLHRAFSIFLVDPRGRLLLQQRARQKYHSGGLWANSCCGHPRPGERTRSAAQRRLGEELGVESALRFGFFARYQASLGSSMQENEFVYVFFGALDGSPQPNPAEVSDVSVIGLADIGRRVAREPQRFTFWLRHYLQHHHAEIASHSDLIRSQNGDRSNAR